jgi:hypothetical protein
MIREIVEGLKPYKDDSAVHNEFKSYKEIEKAVKAGKPVFWANSNYEVQWWDVPKGLYVMSLHNANAIGLGDTKYDIERCYLDKKAAKDAQRNPNSQRYKG